MGLRPLWRGLASGAEYTLGKTGQEDRNTEGERDARTFAQTKWLLPFLETPGVSLKASWPLPPKEARLHCVGLNLTHVPGGRRSLS